MAEVGPRPAAPAAATPRRRVQRRQPPRPTFNASAAKPILRPDDIPASGFGLVLYPKIGMLDGRHAHNAWLHELPDPVTKVTWDNYACLSPAAAAKLGVEDGDVVRVAAADGGAGARAAGVRSARAARRRRGDRARLRPRRNGSLRQRRPAVVRGAPARRRGRRQRRARSSRRRTASVSTPAAP